MNIITVINAKGGCGKSTIAMSLAAGAAHRGLRTLFIDMDPQAQVTQWLGGGDGISAEGTLAAAFLGDEVLSEVIQETHIENLSFVASSEGLEEIGRTITDDDEYQTILARLLLPVEGQFDLVFIDSPNQISPIMENAIFVSNAFVVPFESTKAVRSYANFYKLLLNLRGQQPDYQMMHVLSNISRQAGLRNDVIALLEADRVPLAKTEVRSCGWLAKVDEHGGSIFTYRPASRGAEDMGKLLEELIELLGVNELAV